MRRTFPLDEVEPVPNGVPGADVSHRIMNGGPCGVLLWESKHAKNWNENWVSKLKDDQRRIKADIAVLVSEALPRSFKNLGWYNGIWISSSQCAIGLAYALRSQLIEVSMVKMAAIGKNEKMEFFFNYVSGVGFRQRIQAMVEAIIDMQKDLAKERRVTERRWARRGTQIDKAISSMSGMYGDFQGLIGSSLQTIPLLSSADGQDDP